MPIILITVIASILSSDIFMGVCALLGLLISCIGLFIVSSNIIKINKKVSIINLCSQVMEVNGDVTYNLSTKPYSEKYE